MMMDIDGCARCAVVVIIVGVMSLTWRWPSRMRKWYSFLPASVLLSATIRLLSADGKTLFRVGAEEVERFYRIPILGALMIGLEMLRLCMLSMIEIARVPSPAEEVTEQLQEDNNNNNNENGNMDVLAAAAAAPERSSSKRASRLTRSHIIWIMGLSGAALMATAIATQDEPLFVLPTETPEDTGGGHDSSETSPAVYRSMSQFSSTIGRYFAVVPRLNVDPSLLMCVGLFLKFPLRDVRPLVSTGNGNLPYLAVLLAFNRRPLLSMWSAFISALQRGLSAPVWLVAGIISSIVSAAYRFCRMVLKVIFASTVVRRVADISGTRSVSSFASLDEFNQSLLTNESKHKLSSSDDIGSSSGDVKMPAMWQPVTAVDSSSGGDGSDELSSSISSISWSSVNNNMNDSKTCLSAGLMGGSHFHIGDAPEGDDNFGQQQSGDRRTLSLMHTSSPFIDMRCGGGGSIHDSDSDDESDDDLCNYRRSRGGAAQWSWRRSSSWRCRNLLGSFRFSDLLCVLVMFVDNLARCLGLADSGDADAHHSRRMAATRGPRAASGHDDWWLPKKCRSFHSLRLRRRLDEHEVEEHKTEEPLFVETRDESGGVQGLSGGPTLYCDADGDVGHDFFVTRSGACLRVNPESLKKVSKDEEASRVVWRIPPPPPQPQPVTSSTTAFTPQPPPPPPPLSTRRRHQRRK